MNSKKTANKINAKYSKTVIEFSKNRVKLVQSCFNKNRFINKLIIKDNIADSEYEFINALERIIKEDHIKIDDLIVSLDRSLVTIRSIKLPSTNPEEIKNMADWQAVKLLPYKIDEMVVAHQTVKVDNDGFSHIILVIVPRNIIRKFTNICEALKLKLGTVTISSEGLLEWYYYLQSPEVDNTLLLVDMDKDKAELVIVDRDKFIFSRSFSLAHMPDQVQAEKKIIDEVRLSIESYRKQETFQKVNKIVLTGDKQKAAGLSILFKEEFNLPVDVVDHLGNLDLTQVVFKSDYNQHYSFASASGLALSPRSPQINLCPLEVQDRIIYLEKRRELLKTAALGLSAILLFMGFLGFNIYQKKKIINILDAQIQKIGPAAKEIQDIKNKMSVINSQLNNKNSCIEILREIHQVTPEGIYINTLLFQESNEVTIKGTAATMSLVFSFVPVLNKSLFFDNVQVGYATQKRMSTGELTDFEIVCKLTD